MPLLSDLPPEILIQILNQHHILSEPDLSSLSLVNHRLGSLAKQQLYKSNAQFGESSALSWAAEKGRLATARLALAFGADINVKSVRHLPEGSTPLLLAARNNHTSLVRFFLATKDGGGRADVNSRGNVYHETALSIASQMGHVEVVRILLGHEDIRPDLADTCRQTPLYWACCNKHPAVVKLLVERGDVDVNRQRVDDGATPLMAAAASGCIEVVEALLTRKGEINPNISKRDGTTALMLAAINRHSAILDRLLVAFPMIDMAAQDNQGMTTLSHAVNSGAEPIVHKLLATNAANNVNHQDGKGVTPLAIASKHGFENIVRLLLCHKADPTLLDIRGWSPLHWAAQGGHAAVVKFLLLNDSRVDPGLRSFVGTTPLHCASWDGHYDVIRLLVSCKEGVDINCEDNAGWTPLMWAAVSNNNETDVLRLLLGDPRVRVNTQNHVGMTALHYAAKREHGMAVEILLGHPGIDLAVRDGNGKTAQMYALENGSEDVADRLGKKRSNEYPVSIR